MLVTALVQHSVDSGKPCISRRPLIAAWLSALFMQSSVRDAAALTVADVTPEVGPPPQLSSL